ncbi:S-methyl-5'-thioinosine phosphorylase [Simiduia curdlanivorans]|uniref:Probable S-methyl-5'-thioinosine phosphorylase n=1 Tax=Simiduia curdlanivorans TaxID=1492769 RepID=A0ABV8V858_9GAMM|nr:S-methyl-5'-thioinosine phosphorylase [Simiduia curdlanivorans]MDN3639573.1 S-methyl-5'-thioinosine phosphorylase [Simiduia curdlanivorans]
MLAVIGGSGWETWSSFQASRDMSVDTPYGATSAVIQLGTINHQPVAFLSRHGPAHNLAPHQINYRANIWALKALGVTRILAINAVGGIHASMGPEALIVPDQIIDYTWGRAHSFWSDQVMHVDFSKPFEGALRRQLVALSQSRRLGLIDFGVYGCTQGPRLESAAEIQRLKRDGCDLVGMTAMPEASLARELNVDYASLCISVNWAAGLSEQCITMDAIFAILNETRPMVQGLIEGLAAD